MELTPGCMRTISRHYRNIRKQKITAIGILLKYIDIFTRNWLWFLVKFDRTKNNRQLKEYMALAFRLH